MKKFLLVLTLILLNAVFAVSDTIIEQDTIIDRGTWTGNTNVYGAATLTVSGGDIVSISPFDSSIIDVSGGTIGIIYVTESEHTTINLYGGELTGFHGIFGSSNSINIFGYDFEQMQVDDNLYLSGKWENDLDFEFYFLRSEGLPDIVTLTTIPEPFTLSFLGFGILLLRKNKK